MHDIREILYGFKKMMKEISDWIGKTTEEFNKKMGLKINLNVPTLNLENKISNIEKSLTERKMYKNKTEQKIETSRISEKNHRSVLVKGA